MFICAHAYVFTQVPMAYIFIYAYAYVRIHMHTYVYLYMHTYAYVQTHTFTHMFIWHIYLYTQKHIFKHRGADMIRACVCRVCVATCVSETYACVTLRIHTYDLPSA